MATHRRRILLEYGLASEAWIECLKFNLGHSGYECFFLSEIPPSVDYADQLTDETEDLVGGILVVTPDDFNGNWLGQMDRLFRSLNRQNAAFDYHLVQTADLDKLVNPIRADIIKFPAIDGRDKAAYAAALKELLHRLNPEGETPALADLRFQASRSNLVTGEKHFLDDIFSLTPSHPALLLLAQGGSYQRPLADALLKKARARFGSDSVLHLRLPVLEQPNEFFSAIADQMRRGSSSEKATPAFEDLGGFEEALKYHLTTSNSLFLLVEGLESASIDNSRRVAGALRNALEESRDKLRVVMIGGAGLSALKHEKGALSRLSSAHETLWPELEVSDIMESRASLNVNAESVRMILRAVGGHHHLTFQLIQQLESKWLSPEDIQQAFDSNSLLVDHPDNILASRLSQVIGTYFRNLNLSRDQKSKICYLLEADDLGPYFHWPDPELRLLFWNNLISKRGSRFVWRCPAIRQVGKTVLQCQE